MMQNQYHIFHIISRLKFMGVLGKIRNIFVIIKLYYWFGFVATVKAIVKILSEQTKFSENKSHQNWVILTNQYLKVKFHQLAGSKKFEDKRLMVFANHKSQADFFLHNHVLNHKSNFLSRLAVVLVFPFFSVAYHTLWFFNRNSKQTPEKFNEWLDQKFQNSPRKSLVVYIEGHRMTGSQQVDKTKLKTGMIRYGYRRQLPSQFLMTFGNEKILNQKKLYVSFGQTAYYKLSQIVDPRDFETENEYVNYIKQKFADYFSEVYAQYQQTKKETGVKSMKQQ